MYLAIDLGSTSFKASVFDDDLERISTASHELKYLSREIKVELNVSEVRNAGITVCKQSLEYAGISGEDLSAVGITSQAQTFTVMARSRQAKIPFISWMDKRADKTRQQMEDDLLFANFADHCSFGCLYTSLMMTMVKDVQNNHPGLIENTDRILPLPSFLIQELTGESAIDNNLAAMKGFYSLQTGEWNKDYIEYCGLKVEQLPKIFQIGTEVGKTNTDAEKYGLPAGIPVISAGNDQTAGAYGAKVHENNAALMTLGSAQVAYLYSAQLPAASAKFARGPYPGNKFYRLAVPKHGGSLISLLLEKEAAFKDYPTFFKLAEEARSNGLKTTLDVDEKSTMHWQGDSDDPGQKALATLEFLCKNLADLVIELCAENRPDKYLCAGGGTRNQIWMDILKEKMKKKLHVVTADPLLGAAEMMRKS